MSNEIIVNSGDAKRRLAWKRNALLGQLGRAKGMVKVVLNSGSISRSEVERLSQLYLKIDNEIKYFTNIKSRNVKIIKIK
jgi:hypothetical protein